MERFSRYIRATIAEMKHVKWPTRHQAGVYTVLVIGISAIVMVFVSLADFVFTSGIDFIINRF
ncbi:MAG: preprotein translocase subunit SecE [Candidatus Paceibacteria bacterium]